MKNRQGFFKAVVSTGLLGLSAFHADSQAPIVAGGGYTAPFPLEVSPGQVVTLFVSGVGSGITKKVTASSVPLPYSLAGITALLYQTSVGRPLLDPTPVPIFAVYPASTCVDRFPLSCPAPLLAVTVQIPFELFVDSPESFAATNHAQIEVSDGVGTTGAFQLFPKYNQIHILRQGDMLLDNDGDPRPVVKHPDGSLVTVANPAVGGEELVVYALGLGSTTPAVQTGAAAPSPSSVPESLLSLNFDYLSNAPPRPGPGRTGAQIPPLFVGLVMGTVGVYQFNFLVPPPPAALFACNAEITSNLTVTLYSSLPNNRYDTNSFDGAAICVQPPQP